MLQPDYFTYKSDSLVKMYQDLEDWIIKDISNRLLVAEEMSGSADWQLYKLEQMGMHKSEVIKRVSKMTGKSKEEVHRLLEDAVLTSYEEDKAVFDEMGINIEKPTLNPSIMAVMDAQLVRTNNEFTNLTRTTMFQSSADLMRLMDEAQFRVNTGTQSYSSAICDVLDKYAKRGIVIDYPSGAKRSLESAVQCAMLTAMNQTAAQVTNQYIANNGVEYVLISAHLGARHDSKHPDGLQSHDWWQGKMFKISGSEKGYPNLLESTGYSIDSNGVGHVVNPLGLHGYNCRHSHTPAFKGMDNPYNHPDSAINRAKSQKTYENQQKQRAMERSIRATKRSFLEKQQQVDTISDNALKEQLELERDKIAYKLREQNKAYNEFCKANDLQTQSFRTKTIGFDKNMSAKARGRAAAYKNTINEKNVNNDKLKDNKKDDTISLKDRISEQNEKIDDLKEKFKIEADGYSYNEWFKEFSSIEEGFGGADEDDESFIKLKNLDKEIRKANEERTSLLFKKETRGQLDTGYIGAVPDDKLDEYNMQAYKQIKKDTGYSDREAKEFQNALKEYFGGNYSEILSGETQLAKTIRNGLDRMPTYNNTIFRGMILTNEDIGQFSNLKPGETLPRRGIIESWTSSKGTAMAFGGINSYDRCSVILECVDNKTSVGVQHLSSFGKLESEVLSSAEYEVIDVAIENKYDYLSKHKEFLYTDDDLLEEELTMKGNIVCKIRVKEKR